MKMTIVGDYFERSRPFVIWELDKAKGSRRTERGLGSKSRSRRNRLHTRGSLLFRLQSGDLGRALCIEPYLIVR